MPTFTEFVRGTIVTATKLNELEKGLYWLQLDFMRLAIDNALKGINPGYVSLYFDLFNDTAEFDAGAVTPDMSISTTDGIITLPGGFSINTDYFYQTILHTMPATVTRANMLLLRESIANTTVYPSLSCVGSGAGASFIEKTSPIATRTVNSTLNEWSEDYSGTGNTQAGYTVEFAGGKIKLPGASSDAWAAVTRLTNNAVADVDSEGGSLYAQPQVSATMLANGNIAVLYTSKEHNASFYNYRIRIVKPDGTFVTWGGVDYINVTTATGSDLHSGWIGSIAANAAGTKLGVLYRSSTDLRYARVDVTGGSVDTSFSVDTLSGVSPAKMVRERGSDNVWVVHQVSNTMKGFRFDLTSASAPGAAVFNSTMGGSYVGFDIDVDQEDDVHLIYHDGTNARYNIWDKSAVAWLYTFNTGDKTFACAVSVAWKRDLRVVADHTQSGSNKRAFIVYAKDNASSKSAVFFRDITAGTVGGEVTVKTSTTVDYRWVNAFLDKNSSVVQVVFCDEDTTGPTLGLRANTVTYAGTVGSESAIRSASVDAANAVVVNSEGTKAAILFRDGADDNTAAELYLSTKNMGYTTTAKVWTSVARTVATTATKFFVSAQQTLPNANTTVTWEISANGGTNWTTVSLGATGTFGVSGTSIVLRATLLTTDASQTPEVDSVSWKAQLPLVEEEYEWTGLSGVDTKVKMRGRSSNGSNNPRVHSWGIVFS